MKPNFFSGLRRALSRLHRDERGSAMTEFVICLPVFVMVFVGINNLYLLTDTKIETRLRAVKATWGDAISTQKSVLAPTVQYPWLAGPLGMATATQTDDNTASKVFDVGVFTGLSLKGSLGEHSAANIMLNPFANVPARKDSPSDFGGTQAVQDMWAEHLPKPIATVGQFNLLLVAVPISLVAPRPTGAAGMRYGLASGEDSTDVSVAGLGTVNFESNYNVRNAPFSMGMVPPNFGPSMTRGLPGGLITTGFSRLGLHKHKHYKGLLGIEFSPKLL